METGATVMNTLKLCICYTAEELLLIRGWSQAVAPVYKRHDHLEMTPFLKNLAKHFERWGGGANEVERRNFRRKPPKGYNNAEG